MSNVSFYERVGVVQVAREHPEFTPEQIATRVNKTRRAGKAQISAADVGRVLRDCEAFIGGRVWY